MLLQTPIPTDLPPGRKWLTCCIPNCTERMIMADDALQLICWKHSTTHHFPRDVQDDLGLPTLCASASPRETSIS